MGGVWVGVLGEGGGGFGIGEGGGGEFGSGWEKEIERKGDGNRERGGRKGGKWLGR